MPDHWDADHAAPFADLQFESDTAAAQRIAGIGRRKLRAWWKRFRHYSHPHNAHGCHRASSVAFDLFSDPHGTTSPRTQRVRAIWRQWERAVEETTDGGGQTVIPGAEREPLRQTLERRMAEPIRPRGEVKRMDIGLWAPRVDQGALDF